VVENVSEILGVICKNVLTTQSHAPICEMINTRAKTEGKRLNGCELDRLILVLSRRSPTLDNIVYGLVTSTEKFNNTEVLINP